MTTSPKFLATFWSGQKSYFVELATKRLLTNRQRKFLVLSWIWINHRLLYFFKVGNVLEISFIACAFVLYFYAERNLILFFSYIAFCRYATNKVLLCTQYSLSKQKEVASTHLSLSTGRTTFLTSLNTSYLRSLRMFMRKYVSLNSSCVIISWIIRFYIGKWIISFRQSSMY